MLTIDEIQTAIRQSGIYFDIIGMDSCIMSSLELCCAMYNYCDYMILSEDFESGYGWSYTGWLNALSENTSISSEELGKIIVDDMIADNEENGEGSSTLALIDESYMKVLILPMQTSLRCWGKITVCTSGAAGALILFCGKKGCLIFCLTRMEIIPCQTII